MSAAAPSAARGPLRRRGGPPAAQRSGLARDSVPGLRRVSSIRERFDHRGPKLKLIRRCRAPHTSISCNGPTSPGDRLTPTNKRRQRRFAC
jgi:hypothetical protein